MAQRATGSREQACTGRCFGPWALDLPLRANLSQRVVACASVPLPIAVLRRPLAFCLPPQPKRDVGTGHQWSLGKFTLDTRQFSISARVTEVFGVRWQTGSTSCGERPHPRPAPPPIPDLPASNLDTESRPLPGPSSPLQRSFLKPYLNHHTTPPFPPWIWGSSFSLFLFCFLARDLCNNTDSDRHPTETDADSAPQHHLRISPFRCQARQKKPTPLTSWPTIRTTRATSPSPSRPPAPRRMPRPQQPAAS